MQMNEQHVFSCMDSSFMHTLPEKIEHIRRLRAVDFQEDQEDHDAAGVRDDHPHPQQEAPPPLLLEDVQRDPSPGVDIDAMDVDREESEGEYEEPELDDDDKEAPSEQDTDEAASRGESGHMDTQSDECESIHTQSPQPEFAASPMRGRVLEFEGHEHVTSLAEGEPAEDAYRDEDDEGDANEEQDDEDLDHEGEVEGTLEGELEGDLEGEVEGEVEGGLDDAQEGDCEEAQEEREEAPGEDQQALLEVEDEAECDAAEFTPEVATTSRPSTASLVSKSDQELPPPSAPKSKASKRGKHKDRHTKRHSSRVPEPVIAESALEDKIVGILRSTLPNLLQGT
jgi:hypothetical protein